MAETIVIGGNTKENTQKNQNQNQGQKDHRQNGGNNNQQRENVVRRLKLDDGSARLAYNRLGAQPSMVGFEVSTQDIRKYFVEFFKTQGYYNIVFVNSRTEDDTAPRMYFVLPRKGNIKEGANRNDRVEQLLGGSGHNVPLRLDGRLTTLVRPFARLNDKGFPRMTSYKDDKKVLVIELDMSRVLMNLFGDDNEFRVSLLGIRYGKDGNFIYTMGRSRRPVKNEMDFDDIIKSIDVD